MKQESKVEVLSPHGPVVMHKQRARCRSCDRTFSPSGSGSGPCPWRRDLTPKAAARVGREAATGAFDQGARAINLDWDTSLDGKQIQRWGEALGQSLVDQRQRELEALEEGQLPGCKENEHELLVIGMDGGRVQTREKCRKTGSRWKENKVLTLSSCLKGDGADKPPKKLLTTTMATMQDSHAFGKLARPCPRLAHRLGHHRVGREAFRQTGKGNGAVLERVRSRDDLGFAKHLAQRG